MVLNGQFALSADAADPAGAPPLPVTPIPIALEALARSTPDCDIYIRQGSQGMLTLYRRKSYPLSPADLERLAKRGIREVYISHADQETHRRQVAAEACQNATLPPAEKYHLLREISQASFEAACRSGEVGQVVAIGAELGPQLAAVLADKDLVLSRLISLMDHDDGTYSHCVNVATYTTLLVHYLGVDDHQQLCAVATGALLHDIGKLSIETGILNKPGRLDPAERKRIEQHPAIGFRDLLPRGDLNWSQLMIVYQHHERYDGAGYPVGVPGREIDDLARATAVADVFHALTSVRPYRQPLSTEEACGYLADHARRMFDPEMAQCWISRTKSNANASPMRSAG